MICFDLLQEGTKLFNRECFQVCFRGHRKFEYLLQRANLADQHTFLAALLETLFPAFVDQFPVELLAALLDKHIKACRHEVFPFCLNPGKNCFLEAFEFGSVRCRVQIRDDIVNQFRLKSNFPDLLDQPVRWKLQQIDEDDMPVGVELPELRDGVLWCCQLTDSSGIFSRFRGGLIVADDV